MTAPRLIDSHCQRDPSRLSQESAGELLQQIHDDWSLSDQQQIRRSFRFKDFYQTIAFVNAVAWVANQEDHHTDLEVSYKRCVVNFSTHSVDGLSENDFICAARIDALLDAPD